MNCKKVFCSRELTEIKRLDELLMKERLSAQETIGLLETQISLLHGQIPVPPPTRVDMGALGVKSIIDILVDLWGIEYIAQGHVQIWVGNFQATTIDCLMEFVLWTKVNELLYTDFHVCGDFAIGLMGKLLNTPGWWGTPLGTLLVSLPGATDWHSINVVFACPDRDTPVAKAYFIEPQLARLLNYDKMAALIPMNPEVTLDEMREPGVVGQLIMT